MDELDVEKWHERKDPLERAALGFLKETSLESYIMGVNYAIRVFTQIIKKRKRLPTTKKTWFKDLKKMELVMLNEPKNTLATVKEIVAEAHQELSKRKGVSDGRDGQGNANSQDIKG